MKYFSIEDWKTWEPWDRIQEDKKRYHDYIDTIRRRLPPDLRRLCDSSPEWSSERIYLNDSQVHEIKASFEAQTLMIVLNGEYTDENDRQLGLRRFSLNYKGVTRFQIDEGAGTAYNPGPDADPQDVSLLVRGAYGIAFDDHGWDEIELIEDDLFEHRMLFSSGTETVVRFRDFTLEYADTPHTEATE
jgi:hypothetical protein